MNKIKYILVVAIAVFSLALWNSLHSLGPMNGLKALWKEVTQGRILLMQAG